MTDTTIKIERQTSPQQTGEIRIAMGGQLNQQKTQYISEPITLPSMGYFYPSENPLSKGTVDVAYMTTKHEDLLTSQNLLKKGLVIQKLLENIIMTPGVNIDDLLLGDKNCVLMACRRLSFGDSYGPIDVNCPSCGTSNKTTVDLSSIKNKDLDFSKFERGLNRFDLLLPFSKKTITFKLLTHKDESEIDKDLESLSKISKGNGSFEVTTRLKKMILSVDGISSRADVNKFIDSMPTRDSIFFRKYIREISPDIDSSFDFSCDSCSHSERMALPITVAFFWPES